MFVSGSSRGSDAELKQHTITLGEKQEGDGAAVAFVSPDWTNRLPAMEKKQHHLQDEIRLLQASVMKSPEQVIGGGGCRLQAVSFPLAGCHHPHSSDRQSQTH